MNPSRLEVFSLRVFQAGAIVIALVVVTFEVFELDRFFVPKEFVLHLTALLAGVLAVRAVRQAPASGLDVLLVAFVAWSVLATVFAANVWLASRALAITVSGIVLFWTASGLRHAGLAKKIIHALALMVIAATLTALMQAYGVRTDFFSVNRAPGGTLGNRNFVGHLAAFGLPVVLLAVFQARHPVRLVLWALGTVPVVGCLVLTRSRAAWLGVAAALVVLLAGWLLTGPLRRNAQMLLRLGLVLLCLGGGVFGVLALPNALRWNSDDPYRDTARDVLNYREGSGRGRLVQYGTSFRMAVAHPVFGVGPGNWAVAYPAFAERGDPSLSVREAGTTTNPWPSSDWVALLSERGFIGFLLLVLAWGWLAWEALQRVRRAVTAEEGLPALILLATLAATAVAGAFDAVTLLAWPTFFFWTVMGTLRSPEMLYWKKERFFPDAAAPALETPPAAQPRQGRFGPGLRATALLLLALAAGSGAVRSTGQAVAMGIYDRNAGRDAHELAARLDPGNYRVHLRLARQYRDRAQRCEHALAARALYPNAAQARQLARRCE